MVTVTTAEVSVLAVVAPGPALLSSEISVSLIVLCVLCVPAGSSVVKLVNPAPEPSSPPAHNMEVALVGEFRLSPPVRSLSVWPGRGGVGEPPMGSLEVTPGSRLEARPGSGLEARPGSRLEGCSSGWLEVSLELLLEVSLEVSLEPCMSVTSGRLVEVISAPPAQCCKLRTFNSL